MFKFKTPHDKTKKTMARVALGNTDEDFEKKASEIIKDLTNHENVRITSSGNNSIFTALSSVKGDIIIPDQGGWHGFKQIGKFLNKNIIQVKTDFGLIKKEYLDEIEFKDDSALIYTSFAGYCAEQNTKKISQYGNSNGLTTIEDASAGIGDKKHKLGNGKYSDIIVASTGSPKMINVGSGGFISTDSDIFQNTSIPLKLSKTNNIVCSGIYEELANVKNNLEVTVNATNDLKKHISNTLHANKRGINLIILHDNAKEINWNLKKSLPIDKSGFITLCPNYNRVKTKAISIEIKNLDYNCLKEEYLEKIIKEVNNQL